jgi:hypothetical protein
MRYIPLRTFTDVIQGKTYTTKSFLDEFLWPSPKWSMNENFRAAFARCADAIEAEKGLFFSVTDADHELITQVLQDLDFSRIPNVPASMSRALRRVINSIIDAPNEKPASFLVSANGSTEVATEKSQ